MELNEWSNSWGFVVHTFLRRTGLLDVLLKIFVCVEVLFRFLVSMFYSFVYRNLPESQYPPGDAGDPPLILITGLLGFNPDNLFGLKYFNFDDSKTTRRICIPRVTNIGDNTRRAKQVINQILQKYPGCFDNNKQVDFIAHSQGSLCCDEVIHLLNMQYDKPVRSYIRLSGISQSPAIAEAIVAGDAYRSSILISIISYLLMIVNMANYIIPFTRQIYEIGLPYGLNADEIMRQSFCGFIASDITTKFIFSKKTRTINVVTEAKPWYSQSFGNAIIALGYILLEAVTLGTVSTLSNDGILDTCDQTIDVATKIIATEQAMNISENEIGEIQICGTHTSVTNFPSSCSTLGTVFQLLTAMHQM